jgi:hypothetical protein
MVMSKRALIAISLLVILSLTCGAPTLAGRSAQPEPTAAYATSAPPPTPSLDSLGMEPLQVVQLDTTSPTLLDGKATGEDGSVTFEDNVARIRVRVEVLDAVDHVPLDRSMVYWMSSADAFIVLVVDPDGEYLPAGSIGDYSQSRWPETGPYLVSFDGVPAKQDWETVQLVLQLVKGLETIDSLEGLAGYLADWPDIVEHAQFKGLYADYCLTGKEIANLARSSGLLLPGVGSGGAEASRLVYAAIVAIGTHIAGDEATSYLQSLAGRHALRFYITPFPWIFFKYLGPCDEADTPAPESTLVTPVSGIGNLIGAWKGTASGTTDGGSAFAVDVTYEITADCPSSDLCLWNPEFVEKVPYVGTEGEKHCFGLWEVPSICLTQQSADSLFYEESFPLAFQSGVLYRVGSQVSVPTPEIPPTIVIKISNPYDSKMELEGNIQCRFMGGATRSYDGQRMNYLCSNGWFVIGDPRKGDVWTVRMVRLSDDYEQILEEKEVQVTRIWYWE